MSSRSDHDEAEALQHACTGGELYYGEGMLSLGTLLHLQQMDVSLLCNQVAATLHPLKLSSTNVAAGSGPDLSLAHEQGLAVTLKPVT